MVMPRVSSAEATVTCRFASPPVVDPMAAVLAANPEKRTTAASRVAEPLWLVVKLKVEAKASGAPEAAIERGGGQTSELGAAPSEGTACANPSSAESATPRRKALITPGFEGLFNLEVSGY